MKELDASNITDLFAIDAPLIKRIRVWIGYELLRREDDLEELRFRALLEEIPDQPGTYRKTGQLLVTAKFPDISLTLLIDESSFSRHP